MSKIQSIAPFAIATKGLDAKTIGNVFKNLINNYGAKFHHGVRGVQTVARGSTTQWVYNPADFNYFGVNSNGESHLSKDIGSFDQEGFTRSNVTVVNYTDLNAYLATAVDNTPVKEDVTWKPSDALDTHNTSVSEPVGDVLAQEEGSCVGKSQSVSKEATDGSTDTSIISAHVDIPENSLIPASWIKQEDVVVDDLVPEHSYIKEKGDELSSEFKHYLGVNQPYSAPDDVAPQKSAAKQARDSDVIATPLITPIEDGNICDTRKKTDVNEYTLSALIALANELDIHITLSPDSRITIDTKYDESYCLPNTDEFDKVIDTLRAVRELDKYSI